MNLNPTSEQQAIKDAVRRFCDEQITPERLRAWEKSDAGVDSACWRAAAALGWFGVGLPAAAGGSGLGLAELACLLEECARGLVPRRTINAIRAAYALGRLSPEHASLPALARGDEVVTLALDEESVRDPASYTTTLEADGQRIRGRKAYVVDAESSDWHLVAARDATGDLALALVARAGATVQGVRALDGDRQGHVTYTGAPVVSRLTPAGAGRQQLHDLRAEQSALVLAEMLGSMDAALAMTVAYVKEREQFGQKIAVFQAVQHQVADMAMAYTASRHLAWQAITRLAAGRTEGIDLPAACAFVGQAAKRVTLTAHHLHGGAGYVVEHPLHYHAERVQALCIRHTPESRALAAVAAALLDR